VVLNRLAWIKETEMEGYELNRAIKDVNSLLDKETLINN